MSLEQSSAAGDKAGRPILMAVAVVAVIVVSAALYTLAGSLMAPGREGATQIAHVPAAASSPAGLSSHP
jgi:hypothetical protein